MEPGVNFDPWFLGIRQNTYDLDDDLNEFSKIAGCRFCISTKIFSATMQAGIFLLVAISEFLQPFRIVAFP
jgi:hypothetical protein